MHPGYHWVANASPGTPEASSFFTIVDSTLNETGDGSGEGPIGFSSLYMLNMRNVEINGWTNETMQGQVENVVIDNIEIADNASLNIWPANGVSNSIMIRNSRIGYNTTQPTRINGRAGSSTKVVNSQLNTPVNLNMQSQPELLNCYDSDLTPIPNQ